MLLWHLADIATIVWLIIAILQLRTIIKNTENVVDVNTWTQLNGDGDIKQSNVKQSGMFNKITWIKF